jgi:hypothetical protein
MKKEELFRLCAKSHKRDSASCCCDALRAYAVGESRSTLPLYVLMRENKA